MNARIRKSEKNHRVSAGYLGSAATTAIVLILLLTAADPAYSQPIVQETRQFTFADICDDGTILGNCSRVDGSAVNSISHSNNFDGTIFTTSEARGAARSGLREIASNASIRYRFGAGSNLRRYFVISVSTVTVDVLVLNGGDVYLDFFLPPGFLEVEGNVELPTRTLSTTLLAAITLRSLQGSADSFTMQSILEGGFQGHTLDTQVFSTDPSLDTSPLTHENVNVNFDGFVRTRTWEYNGFQGRIFLGNFSNGQTFTLEYHMQTRAEADQPGFASWAAAAINDPFFLSTDPLPQQDLISFNFVPTDDNPPDPNSKVGVCHREGNGSFHLIRVASQAVQAHRAHGDALPGEDVPGAPGYRFDDACVQVPVAAG